MFKNHLVLSARAEGQTQLIVRDLAAGTAHNVAFEEKVYDVQLSRNPEYDTPNIRFTYTSLVTPDSEFEYDMTAKTRKLLKKKEVPGGYDPAKYESERIFAIAQDGTKVPISLVYKKGLKRDGTAPCLLYGYGSYGISLTNEFDPVRVSLLDRGVVFAQAHIRGGSDMGRTWYDDGKMLKKMNTFTDFIACADFLVAEKYCARERLAIEGGSAGGLLIGSRAEPATRPVQGRGASGAVRGRDHHHARRIVAAHGAGVPAVGQSEGEGRVRVHPEVLPVHEHEDCRVPVDARDDFAQR